MKKLPIEIGLRCKALSNLILSIPNMIHELRDRTDVIVPFILMNKIVYYSDMPVTTYKGITYMMATLMVKNHEEFQNILDKEYKNSKVFCVYNISPTYIVNTSGILVRGAFVPIENGFELKDLISRESQIDEILKG